VPTLLEIEPDDPLPRKSEHNTHSTAQLQHSAVADRPLPASPACSRRERVLLSIRRGGRYLFAIVTSSIATAALAYVAWLLLIDPAYAAQSHSFHYLQHHALALSALGEPLIDRSDPLRGSQLSSSVREQAGSVYVSLRYRVQGSRDWGDAVCEMKKGRGGSWLVVYAAIELEGGGKGRVVLADFRSRIYAEEQREAAAAR
jgi:hypothetical protein